MKGHHDERDVVVRSPEGIEEVADAQELGPFADNDLEQALRSAMNRKLTPKQNLVEASMGRASASVDDLLGVLAGRLLECDEQAGYLSRLSREYLEALFTPGNSQKVDPELALVIAERLTRMMKSHISEARKTSDLMARILVPRRQTVNLLAVSADQVNVNSV